MSSMLQVHISMVVIMTRQSLLILHQFHSTTSWLKIISAPGLATQPQICSGQQVNEKGKQNSYKLLKGETELWGLMSCWTPLWSQTQLYNCLSPKPGHRRRLLLPKYMVQCGLSCRLMTVWNWSPAIGSWEPCLFYLTLFFKNLYKSPSNTNENKIP